MRRSKTYRGWKLKPIENLGSVGPGTLYSQAATKGGRLVEVSIVQNTRPEAELESMLKAVIRKADAEA